MTKETLLHKPAHSCKTWLIAAIVTAIALLGALGVGLEYAHADATIPAGAAFTDVTCDATGDITVEDTGETVDKEGTKVPLYLVTVPEGAETATITFPRDTVFCDKDFMTGQDSVFGYRYVNRVFDGTDWQNAFKNYPGTWDDDYAYGHNRRGHRIHKGSNLDRKPGELVAFTRRICKLHKHLQRRN